MIDGCRSYNMFDDKPDNQPLHYTKSGLSNDVGLDLLWSVVFSKFQTEKKIWVRNQRNKKCIIA
jgi:hypothetical protein